MKKVLLIVAIVLCTLCLFACNNEETDNSNNSTNSDTPNFEIQNVSNLQCKIVFGETDEEIVFEKEKALELYNIIANCNRPTLVLAHNKTLAAQLCSEFREFFP